MRCPIKSGMTILFIPDGMIVMFVIASEAISVIASEAISVIAGLTGNLFNHFIYVNLQVTSLDEIVESMLT